MSETKSGGLQAVVVVVTIVSALILMASTFVLRMTPEVFDSGYNAATWAVVIAVWAAPALLIAGVIVGWIGVIRDRAGVVVLGLVLAALPVLAATGIIVMAG